MRRFINKLTGTEMWVADSRYEEYIAAGHKPAASSLPEEPTEEPEEAPEEPEEIPEEPEEIPEEPEEAPEKTAASKKSSKRTKTRK